MFLKENLALGFFGLKGPKWAQNEVFKSYEILMFKIFLSFCMKLQQESLKIDLVFWEKYCFQEKRV